MSPKLITRGAGNGAQLHEKVTSGEGREKKSQKGETVEEVRMPRLSFFHKKNNKNWYEIRSRIGSEK